MPPKAAVPEILRGIAEGFGLELATKCVRDSGSFAQESTAAVRDMLKHDEGHMRKGLAELATALRVLPPALRECKATEASVEQLVKALASLSSPQAFLYHVGKDLLVNGVSIFKEINAAMVAWKGSQWEAFGKDVGMATKKLFVGLKLELLGAGAPHVVEAMPPKAAVPEILRGIAEGFGLELATQCVRDSGSFAQESTAAVRDMLKHDEGHMRKGLAELATALRVLPPALRECKATKASVEQLVKALASLSSPQ